MMAAWCGLTHASSMQPNWVNFIVNFDKIIYNFIYREIIIHQSWAKDAK